MKKSISIFFLAFILSISVLLISTAFAKPKYDPDILKDIRSNSETQKLEEGVTVLIYIDPKHMDLENQSKFLKSLGIEVLSSKANPIVAVIHDLDDLQVLNNISWVSYISLKESYNEPDYIGNGVYVINADYAWDLGYYGQGVGVGILDLGFDGWENLLCYELPCDTVFFRDNGVGDYVHGTACAEIVHDVAPNASLYLANEGDTTYEKFRAVKWMIENGVKIISHSVSNFGWGPSYFDSNGDGEEEFWDIYKIVEYALNNGVVWVNSAGNYGNSHWEGNWTDCDEDGYLDFEGCGSDPEKLELNETLYFEDVSSLKIWIRWSDYNYPDSYPTNDFDAYLSCYVNGDLEIVDISEDPQDGSFGQEPFEFLHYSSSEKTDCVLVIKEYDAPDKDKMHFDIWWSGYFTDETSYGSVTPPADHPRVIAVGAVPWDDPWSVEDYSSRGPAYNPYVGAFNITKPDVSAPDNIYSVAYDDDFPGTSAATPHVAGVIALMLSANPHLTPEDVVNVLRNTATDIEDPGIDNTSGYGLVDAGLAVLNVSSCNVWTDKQEYYVGETVVVYFSPVPSFGASYWLVIYEPNGSYYVMNLDPGQTYATITPDHVGLYRVEMWVQGVNPGAKPYLCAYTYFTVNFTNEISNCTIISSPGYYNLVNDIINSDVDICIKIESSDVVLDGAGHRIDGSGIAAIYVSTNLSNVTIKNVTITGWYWGVKFYQVNDSTISNCSISETQEAIEIHMSYWNTVENCSLMNNRESILLINSKYNTIKFNDIRDNLLGIEGGEENRIYLNNFVNNSQNVIFGINVWHSPQPVTYTYNGRAFTKYLGNYWDDYIGEDADGDGIGDVPYVIDSNNQDPHPLVEPFEEFFKSPVADFIYYPPNPIVNQTITFNASSSYDPDGQIVSYEWKFGDGCTASGVIVTHTYTQPGTYTVTLTVRDNDGLASSISKSIIVSNIGDVNGDGSVNVLDVIRVGQHFGETGEPGWIPEDLNKDGVINVLDIIIIGQNWTG